MDFRLPSDGDQRRQEVRAWLDDHPEPSPAELARAGYVAPGWPPPWGLDADPEHQLLIDQELRRRGIDAVAHNPIGIGWAGPTILAAGNEEQKQRYLTPLLTGEEFWCQLFSEPGAGSDLAGLGTRAVKDGDEWIVNGQKVWTTWAGDAAFGILLARTDPEAPKHEGITYFIFPMRQPGVEIRPIREMTGNTHFNEVFFTDARVPAANVVGEVHRGWPLARFTLGNERVSLSSGGLMWGMGPTTGDLLDIARRHVPHDRLITDRLARAHIESEVQRILGLRILSELIAGREPGPEAAVKKLLADRHGQVVADLAKDMAGPDGLTGESGPCGEEVGEWHWAFLFARALTIGGGTAQVLKNVVAERILGLPRDMDPEVRIPWNQTTRG